MGILFFIASIYSSESTITAIIRFETKDAAHQMEAKSFTDCVRSAIAEDSRYYVLEESIVDEMLNQSNGDADKYCSNENCLLSIGKRNSIRYVIGGGLFFDKKENAQVKMFLIDTEVGRSISILHKKMDNIYGNENRYAVECIKELLEKIEDNSNISSKKPLLKKFSFWGPFTGVAVAVVGGVLYIKNKNPPHPNNEMPIDDAPIRKP